MKLGTEEQDMIKEFRELVQKDDYDALEYWYPKLNPLVKGLPKARKCCLVSLGSINMTGRLRNRINCLLWGEYGTGKSMIRNWIVDYLGAVGASPQSSDAGLIYDARGEGTPGALSIAHESTGVVAIEEFTQFSKNERELLRQAMESGYYEINKGDHRMRIDTEVVVIAAANEIDKFSRGLLERFDLKVKLEKPTQEKEIEITDYLYDHWEDEEIWNEGTRLKHYMDWVRQYDPYVDEGVKEQMKKMKNLFIQIYHDKGEGSDIRQKQTFYRSAKVIARLNHREVRADDFITAIELHNGKMPSGIVKALKTIE